MLKRTAESAGLNVNNDENTLLPAKKQKLTNTFVDIKPIPDEIWKHTMTILLSSKFQQRKKWLLEFSSMQLINKQILNVLRTMFTKIPVGITINISKPLAFYSFQGLKELDGAHVRGVATLQTGYGSNIEYKLPDFILNNVTTIKEKNIHYLIASGLTSKLTNLTNLNIWFSSQESEIEQQMIKLTTLKTLKIKNYWSNSGKKMNDDFILTIPKTLKTLHLSDNNMTITDKSLSTLTNLTSLKLKGHNSFITNESISCLIKLTSLNIGQFTLSNDKKYKFNTESILKLTNLQYLKIHSSHCNGYNNHMNVDILTKLTQIRLEIQQPIEEAYFSD